MGEEKRRGIDWKHTHGREENGYFMCSACMTDERGCRTGLLVTCCPTTRGHTKNTQAGWEYRAVCRGWTDDVGSLAVIAVLRPRSHFHWCCCRPLALQLDSNSHKYRMSSKHSSDWIPYRYCTTFLRTRERGHSVRLLKQCVHVWLFERAFSSEIRLFNSNIKLAQRWQTAHDGDFCLLFCAGV